MLATANYYEFDVFTLMPGLRDFMQHLGIAPTTQNAATLLDRWGRPVEFEKGAPAVAAALKLQPGQPVPYEVLGAIIRTGVLDRVPMRTATGLYFPDRPVDVYVGGATVFWMERRWAELALMIKMGLQVRGVYAAGSPTRKTGLGSEVTNPYVQAYHTSEDEYPTEHYVQAQLYRDFTDAHGLDGHDVIEAHSTADQVALLPDSVLEGLYVVTNANAHYNGLAVRRALQARDRDFDVTESGLWWSGDSVALAMTPAATKLPRDAQNPLTVICGDVPRMAYELLQLGASDN